MSKRNSPVSMAAMMMGGIAAGILGGRMLPPLFAALKGSKRVRAGGDPFALLIQDHRRIRSLLNEMAATGPDRKAQRMRLFLMLKRKLAKHALAEEDVVYPIVHERAAGADLHLYDEHAQMKILLYDIERIIMEGQDWRDAVGRLRDLIVHHIDEEENRIFPELRRELGGTLPKVSAQIEREEALIV